MNFLTCLADATLIRICNRQRDDYEERQGVTQLPLTTLPFHTAPSPLHRRINILKWFEKFLYRSCAKIPRWRKSQDGKGEKLDEIEDEVRVKFFNKTGMKIDSPTSQGGNTDTGNVAWNFFDTKSARAIRDILESYRVQKVEEIMQIHVSLSIILRVVSSKRKVDLERYRAFCQSTYLDIVTQFPWVSVTECLHDVLGHSPEAIEINDGCGLGRFTEQGSEACNKDIRRFSEVAARHTSLDDNIFDVMRRLMIRSDPVVLSHARQSYCSRCETYGSHWTVGKMSPNLKFFSNYNRSYDF